MNYPSRLFARLFSVCFTAISITPGYLLAQPVSETLPATIEKVLPSAVTIMSLDEYGNYTGHGSGFFLTADGEVVTNHHVIRGHPVDKLWVVSYHGGYHRVVQVISAEEKADVAILKVQARDVSFASLSDTHQMEVGETAFVIGTPAKLEYESTVSKGIISRLSDNNDIKEFQFDAAISAGSSGGPVFNVKGQVIGIVRATQELAAGGRPTQNINLGISSKEIFRVRMNVLPPPDTKRKKTFDVIMDTLENTLTYKYSSSFEYPISPAVFGPRIYNLVASTIAGRYARNQQTNEKYVLTKNAFLQRTSKLISSYIIERFGRDREAQDVRQKILKAYQDNDTTAMINGLRRARLGRYSDTTKYVLMAASLSDKMGEMMSAYQRNDSAAMMSILVRENIGITTDTTKLILALASYGTADSLNDMRHEFIMNKFFTRDVPLFEDPNLRELETLWYYGHSTADTIFYEDQRRKARIKNSYLYRWDSTKNRIYEAALEGNTNSRKKFPYGLTEMIAITCITNGQYEDADRFYKRLISENPTDPSYHRNRGIVLLLLGDVARGMEELRISWKMSRSSEIEFLYALHYLKKYRFDLAYDLLSTTSYNELRGLKTLALGAAAVLTGRSDVALRKYGELKDNGYSYAKLLFNLLYD